MIGPVSGRNTPPAAVIPFYAGGAVAFSVLCLQLFLSAGSLTAHYFNPHLLSIVHTAALGWGTMVIFGAAHQLLPVVCEKDLYSPPLAVLTWYTLTAGTALLVFSFRDFRAGWLMLTGGALVVLSAVFYVVNVWLTAGGRYDVVRAFILSSAVWLLLTVIIGLLLAINLSTPFFTKNHLEILKLHAHAGFGGWFLQLITGVSVKLVPMFLLGKSGRERLLRFAFILQNTGLILFLAGGYFFGISPGIAMIAGALTGAGVVCWLLYLGDAYRNRIRKRIDFQMKHTFLSFGCLLLALLLIPVIAGTGDPRWAVVYGSLIFMGWITGIILGKTFKTLPFIVWNMHYRNLTGKAEVPLPKDLYREAPIRWQYVFFIASLLSLTAGIIADSILIIRLSSVLWMALSLLYLYNVLTIIGHKTFRL